MTWRNSTILCGLVVVALGILALGGLNIWYRDKDNRPSSNDQPSPEAAADSTSNPPLVGVPKVLAPPSSGNALPRSSALPSNSPSATLMAAKPAVAVDWYEKIEALVNSGAEDRQVAHQLVAWMPKMPDSNQVDAAEYVVDLLPDDAYGSVIPMVTNSLTNPEVLDVFMTDLLNRPIATVLPLFLDVARNPQHPRHDQARDYLELFVDQDYGNDWEAWDRAVRKYVRENPD